MVRIAIVEDDPNYRQQLRSYIERYGTEKNIQFQITAFTDGIEIAEHYTSDYDIIFMDIQMKQLDGMDTARRIRKLDSSVAIIFITNLAQFALQGYQVEALSYVLKPINYFAFSQEIGKAVKKNSGKSASFLHFMQDGNMVRLDVSEIIFVEIQNHDAVYHTLSGDFINRETLKSVAEKLEKHHFSRCNQSFLVNLAYVEQVNQNEVTVAGTPLRISRTRKKAFMEDLTVYVGGR